MRNGRSERWLWPLIVFTCGLAGRLLFVVWAPYPAGDSGDYMTLARSILDHGRFGFVPGSPSIARPPGYPWFLAALGLFVSPENLWQSALWVQSIIGAAAGVLLLQVLERHFSASLARVVAVGAALYPQLNIISATILSETLITSALLQVLWAVDTARLCAQEPNGDASARGQVLAGVLAAVAAAWCVWLTPRFVVVAPLAACALWLGCRPYARRGAWRASLACALVCATLLAPWTWRNWRIFGVATPSALQSPGLQFWLAARRAQAYDYQWVNLRPHPLLQRHFSLATDAAHEQARIDERLQLERDFFRDGAAFIAADPRGYTLDRARQYRQLWLNPSTYLVTFRPPLNRLNARLDELWRRGDLLSLVVRVLPVLLWVVLPAVLVPWGLWSARFRWREFALAYALFAWVSVTGAAFYIEQRYSIIVHPLLSLFVAQALQDIQRLWRSPKQRVLGIGRSEATD